MSVCLIVVGELRCCVPPVSVCAETGVCFALWQTVTQQRIFFQSWLKHRLREIALDHWSVINPQTANFVTTILIYLYLLRFSLTHLVGARCRYFLSAVLIGWYEGQLAVCTVCFYKFCSFDDISLFFVINWPVISWWRGDKLSKSSSSEFMSDQISKCSEMQFISLNGRERGTRRTKNRSDGRLLSRLNKYFVLKWHLRGEDQLFRSKWVKYFAFFCKMYPFYVCNSTSGSSNSWSMRTTCWFWLNKGSRTKSSRGYQQ